MREKVKKHKSQNYFTGFKQPECGRKPEQEDKT
jgi:hypothetical protein